MWLKTRYCIMSARLAEIKANSCLEDTARLVTSYPSASGWVEKVWEELTCIHGQVREGGWGREVSSLVCEVSCGCGRQRGRPHHPPLPFLYLFGSVTISPSLVLYHNTLQLSLLSFYFPRAYCPHLFITCHPTESFYRSVGDSVRVFSLPGKTLNHNVARPL